MQLCHVIYTASARVETSSCTGSSGRLFPTFSARRDVALRGGYGWLAADGKGREGDGDCLLVGIVNEWMGAWVGEWWALGDGVENRVRRICGFGYEVPPMQE